MDFENRATKIFLDGGNADETKKIIDKLGFLDGQTTNPTYFIKKNPKVLEIVRRGEKLKQAELLELYKRLAQELSALLPKGSISLEVYVDKKATKQEIINQAREMYGWIPNAHIKIPIVRSGLEAAEVLSAEGMRLNMTLCFSQEQAAAVHAATKGSGPGQIFISPFVSRLDKIGKNGFDLLLNIQKMYKQAKSHVSILAASVHSVYDIARILEYKLDIITVPFVDLSKWIYAGQPQTTKNLPLKNISALDTIPYLELDLEKDWSSFNIKHELTEKGLQFFADDWNSIIE